MNKISMLTLAMLVASGVNVSAEVKQAGVKSYVKGGLSYNKMKVTEKGNGVLNGKSTGFSIGYGASFGKGLRADAELKYILEGKKNEFNDEDPSEVEASTYKSKTTSLMLNGYYDICTGTKWIPYVTAGIGLARNEFNYSETEIDTTVLPFDVGTEVGKITGTKFAYQAGLGVAYAINDAWKVDAGYKYSNYGKISKTFAADDQVELKNKVNAFEVSARYAF